jgi:CheY-like chemotaxis protein
MAHELYIVDDNADYQFLIYKLIKELELPCSVKFFENGKSLYKHMQQLGRSENAQLPDLIILDFNMPSMTGIELLRLCRQPPLSAITAISSLPIVIMSNLMTPQQIHQCYQAGANAVVSKPLDFTVMKDTLRSMCKFWMR